MENDCYSRQWQGSYAIVGVRASVHDGISPRYLELELKTVENWPNQGWYMTFLRRYWENIHISIYQWYFVNIFLEMSYITLYFANFRQFLVPVPWSWDLCSIVYGDLNRHVIISTGNLRRISIPNGVRFISRDQYESGLPFLSQNITIKQKHITGNLQVGQGFILSPIRIRGKKTKISFTTKSVRICHADSFV